jgi:hypothetical protein
MKIVPDRPNLVCILPAMQRRQYDGLASGKPCLRQLRQGQVGGTTPLLGVPVQASSPVWPISFHTLRPRASPVGWGSRKPWMLGGGWPGPASCGHGDQ